MKTKIVERIHPNDIYNKGLLYDTLKKEYDELRIRHDRAYAEKILAEAKRDKCIEALREVIKHLDPTDIDFKEGSVGSIRMATNRCGVADLSLDKAIITAIQLIKNNKK